MTKEKAQEYWDAQIQPKYPDGILSCGTKKEERSFMKLYEEYLRIYEDSAIRKKPKKVIVRLGGGM